jgi:hypothetical protein
MPPKVSRTRADGILRQARHWLVDHSANRSQDCRINSLNARAEMLGPASAGGSVSAPDESIRNRVQVLMLDDFSLDESQVQRGFLRLRPEFHVFRRVGIHLDLLHAQLRVCVDQPPNKLLSAPG